MISRANSVLGHFKELSIKVMDKRRHPVSDVPQSLHFLLLLLFFNVSFFSGNYLFLQKCLVFVVALKKKRKR